jgi:hypothetical protein
LMLVLSALLWVSTLVLLMSRRKGSSGKRRKLSRYLSASWRYLTTGNCNVVTIDNEFGVLYSL